MINSLSIGKKQTFSGHTFIHLPEPNAICVDTQRNLQAQIHPHAQNRQNFPYLLEWCAFRGGVPCESLDLIFAGTVVLQWDWLLDFLKERGKERG